MKKQLLALAFSCFVLWGSGDALAAKPTDWSFWEKILPEPTIRTLPRSARNPGPRP